MAGSPPPTWPDRPGADDPWMPGSAGVLGRLDLAAQDLPGWALGQLVDQPDLPRVLVGGDLVAGERAQFVRGRAGVRLQRHGRADLLAEIVVRDPDHGHLGHRRV